MLITLEVQPIDRPSFNSNEVIQVFYAAKSGRIFPFFYLWLGVSVDIQGEHVCFHLVQEGTDANRAKTSREWPGISQLRG